MIIINPVCERCGRGCEVPCEALHLLFKTYDDLRTEEKTGIIRALRTELNIIDYEVAQDLKDLGDKIIEAMPELHVIKDFDIKVGYVRSYEPKRNKSKIVNADCRKVKGTYTAYLPFDFIVTFYEPNIYYMTENQKKVLMLHELRHIGVGEKGFKIVDHDIEDFKDILTRYGMDWNGFDQEVADILAGGDVERETKGNKMAAKSKADCSCESPVKSGRSKNKN